MEPVLNWSEILIPSESVMELFARATLMYFTMLILLKVVVKRQTGSTGTTDILVTVLIAEVAGPAFTADYRSITEGTVLVATVLGWSYVVEWLMHRFTFVERFFDPPPVMLIKEGKMLFKNMRKELITKNELLAQLRENGVGDIEHVREARMEADGVVSVLKKGAP